MDSLSLSNRVREDKDDVILVLLVVPALVLPVMLLFGVTAVISCGLGEEDVISLATKLIPSS